MKLALLGYGKMGREIEMAAEARGHEVVLKIDVNNQSDITSENLRKADVAIDFTTPAAAVKNIYSCFEAGVPVVCGTTGWNKDMDAVRAACIEKDQALFHSSNFSIGVNILFAVNEYLAGIMNKYSQYDVSIEEVHHTQKLDAPSGTAISIAEQIISKLERKNSWSLEPAVIDPLTIPIKAVREGDIKGIHEIRYDSEVDYIVLKHFSKSRKGLALGAVMASEFIAGKKGVFTMRDLLGL
jgi:4-hydroxy-tetrahydrodipicolinate reductase